MLLFPLLSSLCLSVLAKTLRNGSLPSHEYTIETCENSKQTACADLKRDCASVEEGVMTCGYCYEFHVGEPGQVCSPETCENSKQTTCEDLKRYCASVEKGVMICGDCVEFHVGEPGQKCYSAQTTASYKCDFESGTICNFLVNDRYNTENWKVGRGKMNSLDTGPSVDHTLGNANGSYLYVNFSAAETNEVKIQSTKLMTDYCVRFFYHMYGQDIGTLTVEAKIERTSESMRYFSRSETQGDRWKEALISVNPSNSMRQRGYRIIFTAKQNTSSSVKGDIALDDVEFTNGKCPDSKKEVSAVCTFDDYDCGYTSSRTGSFSWEWKTAGSQVNYGGDIPEQDHTLGTNMGGYWFSGSKHGWLGPWKSDRALLSSPLYDKPKTSTNCLHFYYYVDGDGSNSFWGSVKEAFVQVLLNFPQSNTSRVWLTTKAKNTTFHRQWRYAETKAEITEKFQLQFSAGIDSPVYALIAVDDIKLVPGVCPEAGFCDFEDDKCNWADGIGEYNWVRQNGSSYNNSEIGPSTDNTMGTESGNYVVFSTDEKEAGAKANLESEYFPPGQDELCLSFYYYMSGKDLGTLKVLRNEENVTQATLWFLKGDQGSLWQKGMAVMKPSVFHNNVVFQGIIGDGTNGFMALDDIKVRKGENCQLAPTAADPRYEATCGNGGSKICDSTNKKCINKVGGGYECKSCKDGFMQKDGTDECIPATCETGGSTICDDLHKKCTNKDGKGFECGSCKDGFTKKDDTEECVLATCETGGSTICDDLRKKCTNKDGKGFECGSCKDGFTKKDGTEECVLETCGNVGSKVCDNLNKKCTNKAGGGYECGGCKVDFTKKDGTEECVLTHCGNGGDIICGAINKKCTNKAGGGYECKGCIEGFMQKDGMDECIPVTCGNIGEKVCDDVNKKCTDKYRGGFVCEGCKDGFMWKNGTEECVLETCGNVGNKVCDDLNKKCTDKAEVGYECGDCIDGFIKKNGTEECVLVTCESGGTKICDTSKRKCTNKDGGGFDCGDCKYGFMKKDSTEECVPGPCSSNPCQNNGTCFDDGHSFKCFCKAPYIGEVCQEGPCTRNPCNNNGTCFVNGYSYKCFCKAPYSGETCDEGPCSENPCLNDGTCIVNGYSFKCKCRTPYFGKVCQEECDCGAGLCKIDQYGKKFCECGINQKEQGGKCVDICSTRACVYGECEVVGDDYYCRCDEGFTGARCDERVLLKTKDTNLLVAIAVFLCFIACFMLGSICFLLRRRRSCK